MPYRDRQIIISDILAFAAWDGLALFCSIETLLDHVEDMEVMP